MLLESWAEYMPPPGSEYRITYEPDGPVPTNPDLQAFGRSLDRRPGVALKGITTSPGNHIVADVQIFLGDTPLVTALGSYHSDGTGFWTVKQVLRTDDGVPNKVAVTAQRVIDAVLDPVEDVASAGGAALSEVTDKVTKVGLPSAAIIGVAVLAFLFFSRMR